MKEVMGGHRRAIVIVLAALLLAALYAVLCATVVFARPTLVPTSLDEIKQVMAAEGSAVVLVTLDDGAVQTGPAVFSKQEAGQDQQAFQQQLLVIEGERNAAVREQVLQDVNESLEPTLLDGITGMFSLTGMFSITGLFGMETDAGESATGDGAVETAADAPPVNVIHEYATSSGFTAEVTPEGLDALAASDSVKSITLDRKFPVALAQSVPLIDAPDAWSRAVNGVSLRGEGTAICVIDTGIDYAHPAFAGRIIDSRCFLPSGCPGDILNASDNDPNSHGTHVAGIAAANGSYVGVAPAANLVIVKACDAGGNCDLSAMTAGVDWCVNVSAEHNISAISISISDAGHYETVDTCPYDEAFEGAVDAARELGITITIASGNSGGIRGIGWPSCIPSATSVGSTTKSDTLSGFQVGDLLDLLAPGSSITSTLRNGNYGVKSGTSMSTPHAAGAAAIIWQDERLRNRAITPGLIEDILRNMSGVRVVNWTRVDVINAINARDANLSYNASSYTVSGPGGSIRFPSAIDSADLPRCVNISRNNITVDSFACPQYNVSATLTMTGLSYSVPPLVFRDGVRCAGCNITLLAGSSVSVGVGGFSSYTTSATASLAVRNNPTTPLPFQAFTVYANYTNASSGELVNASAQGFGNVSCAVTLPAPAPQGNTSNATNSSASAAIVQTMTQDSGTLLFTATLRINASGTQGYNVSCDGAAVGLEEARVAVSFSMLADNEVPAVTLQAPANGTVTNASAVTFTFNASDNSGYIQNCTLYIDGINAAAVIEPRPLINQTINATINDGNHSWALRCVDGGRYGSLTDSWRLSVVHTNHMPIFIGPLADLDFLEDGSASANLSAAFYDTDNDELSYRALAPGNLTVSISVVNGTANATVRGQANTYGAYPLVFVANDSAYNASSNNITVRISSVYDAPVFSGEITDKSWDINNDRTSVFDLDSHFSDVDNQTIVLSANGTSHISVIIDATLHNVTFHPENNWSGIEYVQFSAYDGRNRTYSNTVRLTVNNVSDSGGGGGGGGSTPTCQNACPRQGPFGCAGLGTALRCDYIAGTSCLGLVPVNCSASEQCMNAVCEPKPCVPEWQCGEWTSCFNAIQTRVCTDKNNCNLALNKPATQQYCTTPRPAPTPVVPTAESPATTPPTNLGVTPAGNATNETVTCGDGSCSWGELCFADCTARNVRAVLVLLAIGGIAGIMVMRIKREAALPKQ